MSYWSTSSADPFDLKCRLKTQRELRDFKGSKVVTFYQEQNERIESFLCPIHEHARQARDSWNWISLRVGIMILGSPVATVILAPLQIYSASSSGSLSLIVVSVDAVMSILSYSIIPMCNWKMKRVDISRYPVGKSRLETVGQIVFRFLVTLASFVLITISVQQLIVGSKNAIRPADSAGTLDVPAIIVSCIAFTINLICFCYGFPLRKTDSQIHTLWSDFRDKLLINGLGILTTVGGSKLRWWINPGGAIIISCFTMVAVSFSMWHQFQLLIGITADIATLQHVTYVAVTHSKHIQGIDTVRAWYSGPLLVVEVDVVMDPDESLRVCHDVAEELQVKLESLPDVGRAYVHVDYETSHRPEHFLKK